MPATCSTRPRCGTAASPTREQAGPERMRVVVAGGAGFLGFHLCQALLARGDAGGAVDNLITGSTANVDDLAAHDGFNFVKHDVTEPLTIEGPVDWVMNLASPASPPDYLELPLETLDVGSLGTRCLLQLALGKGARFFQASTSEVYGDPLVHPQTESYWGHVNPIGPRSVYDEAKRFGEALTMAYQRARDLDVRIVRIFNTYGPRMRPQDGRVVSNFLVQAIRGESITIYGDGTQTRSFCYVDDEIRGFLALMESDHVVPVNIGNPNEYTVAELAKLVLDVTGSGSEIVYRPRPVDDPMQRRPDISKAIELLGWRPQVEVEEGLERTAAWFRE